MSPPVSLIWTVNWVEIPSDCLEIAVFAANRTQSAPRCNETGKKYVNLLVEQVSLLRTR
jgi:hypothetical protein